MQAQSPKAELRRGLVPKLPPAGELPRAWLQEEEGVHQRQCEEREARWDSELAETLATAEEVRRTRHCVKSTPFEHWK